jgi:hypothetical protein
VGFLEAVREKAGLVNPVEVEALTVQ